MKEETGRAIAHERGEAMDMLGRTLLRVTWNFVFL